MRKTYGLRGVVNCVGTECDEILVSGRLTTIYKDNALFANLMGFMPRTATLHQWNVLIDSIRECF